MKATHYGYWVIHIHLSFSDRRLITIKREENGVFLPIPFDMLDDAGITDGTQVEVWGLVDGTLSFRIATICELCGRGAKLFEINMGSVKRKICAEDYKKLLREYPQTPTTEEPTKPTEQQ